ncbi:MAG: hypothetical protein OHK0017_08220 [Patescibacteria group bacterium]
MFKSLLYKSSQNPSPKSLIATWETISYPAIEFLLKKIDETENEEVKKLLIKALEQVLIETFSKKSNPPVLVKDWDIKSE